MYTRIVKRGVKNEERLFIATTQKKGNEHSLGAVSHYIGTDEVTIRSNVPSWGSIPIKRRENLKMMRDALIKICEMGGI